MRMMPTWDAQCREIFPTFQKTTFQKPTLTETTFFSVGNQHFSEATSFCIFSGKSFGERIRWPATAASLTSTTRFVRELSDEMWINQTGSSEFVSEFLIGSQSLKASHQVTSCKSPAQVLRNDEFYHLK